MTLKQLETLVLAHLQESEAIKADLQWLKKALWLKVTSSLTFYTLLTIAIITYMLNHK